ncbi:MAG: glycoside hydrolase family 15 protein [Candidatus Bathyarchaeota archaeon]
MPADDYRVISTVDQTYKELGVDCFVYRYKASDGLTGEEGVFNICSFWFIRCLSLLGRLKDARKTFEKMLKYTNHLGLFAEETNLTSGEMLGNFPQAFTHIGLINAAVELDRLLREENKKKNEL